MEPALQLHWDAAVIDSEFPELRRVVSALDAIVKELANLMENGGEVIVLTVAAARRPRGGSPSTVSMAVQATPLEESSKCAVIASSCLQQALNAKEGLGADVYGLIARNPLRCVSAQPLLPPSRLASSRPRLYQAATAVCILVASCMMGQVLQYADRRDLIGFGEHGATKLMVRTISWPGMAVLLTFLSLFMYLILQSTPKAILKLTMFTFDACVLTANGVLLNSVQMYNHVLANAQAKTMSPTELVVYVVVGMFVSTWLVFLVANTDAFCFNLGSNSKFACMVAALVGYGYSYIRMRFVSSEWVAAEMCYWAYCASPRSIALTAFANILFFLFKMFMNFLTKRTLTVLHTQYYDSRFPKGLVRSAAIAVRAALCKHARPPPPKAVGDSRRLADTSTQVQEVLQGECCCGNEYTL